jgi:hypothetical protein
MHITQHIYSPHTHIVVVIVTVYKEQIFRGRDRDHIYSPHTHIVVVIVTVYGIESGIREGK